MNDRPSLASCWRLGTILLITVGPPALAAPPEPPSHPHHVYLDEASRKLFWPMDLPFWVRLSASPEAAAPSFLLDSIAGATTADSARYDKEGIKLEIKGPQFIRWLNVVTKETTYLQFFADGQPPVTRAVFAGAPTATVPGRGGSRTFYARGLRVSLEPRDELSGVDFTMAAVDEAPFARVEGPLAFDEEKEVLLRYYAVDRVGYQGAPAQATFTIDGTPPVTSTRVVGLAVGNVLSTRAAIELSSADRLSGVQAILAGLDGAPLTAPSSTTIPVAALSGGEHLLTYLAVDRVGNREPPSEFRFVVDRTPPAVSSAIEGGRHPGPKSSHYVSGRSRIVLSARDDQAGVEEIAYSVGAGKLIPYTGPIPLPQKPGDVEVLYRATDRLGNASAVQALACKMDLAPPVTSHRFEGPSFAQRAVVWITRDTRISLSARDEASGVKGTEYQVGEGNAAAPAAYQAALAFPEEGRRLLRYWSTDNVDNRELDRAVVLITDNVPPEIFATFSIVSTGTADGLPVYPRFTTLFLGATDNSAGIKSVRFAMNGRREVEYERTLVFDEPGTYQLEVRAEDNLGNTAQKGVAFVIRD